MCTRAFPPKICKRHCPTWSMGTRARLKAHLRDCAWANRQLPIARDSRGQRRQHAFSTAAELRASELIWDLLPPGRPHFKPILTPQKLPKTTLKIAFGNITP